MCGIFQHDRLCCVGQLYPLQYIIFINNNNYITIVLLLDDNTLHEKVVDVLKRIKTDCVIDDDETQPHLCNQGIAFSTGEEL